MRNLVVSHFPVLVDFLSPLAPTDDNDNNIYLVRPRGVAGDTEAHACAWPRTSRSPTDKSLRAENELPEPLLDEIETDGSLGVPV
jgi:hypothetical protein